MLDFGKSIPSFAAEDERRLPNRELASGVARALGADVVELGFFY